MNTTENEIKSIVIYLHSHGIETTAREAERFLKSCQRQYYAGFGRHLTNAEILEKILKGKKLWVMLVHAWFGDSLGV